MLSEIDFGPVSRSYNAIFFSKANEDKLTERNQC